MSKQLSLKKRILKKGLKRFGLKSRTGLYYILFERLKKGK